jgi:hypothetical protein
MSSSGLWPYVDPRTTDVSEERIFIVTAVKTSSIKKNLNSVAVVRKRTIPTERPPLVGEVSANFCRYRVLRGQLNEFPRPLISFF